MSRSIEDPRREFLINALGLGIIAGVNTTGLFQASHALGKVPPKLPAGRSIYKLKGLVKVDGKIADIDTVIGPNSVVKTGSNSHVIFVVASDAFILRSNSQLEMGGSGLLVEGMRIITGKILSVFGKRENTHSITTATATIGIRGTGIYVESDPELSYVCTCYGRTLISANVNPNVTQDILAERHDQPVYVLPRGSDKNLILPAPIINHTDTELALIEELVGRTTPYSVSKDGYKNPVDRGYGGDRSKGDGPTRG
jgi:hypothetical protein